MTGVQTCALPICLASRIPFGTPVDPDALARIDRAETALKALGLGPLRVRHFGALGRVELSDDDLERRDELAAAIEAAVLDAGYDRVKIAADPFRSGSLTIAQLGSRA